MKTYKIPIIIERLETLNVQANSMDEAIQQVESLGNRDIEKYMIERWRHDYPIPKHAHVEIDWDLVEEYNPTDGGV